MLGKKIPLTILFCGLILPNFSVCEWQEYEVSAIINSDEWLLNSGQYFTLKDLNMPDLNFPNKNNQCFMPLLEEFLSKEVLGQKILIQANNPSRKVRNKPKHLSGLVKSKDTRLDLAYFFIDKGWGDYVGDEKDLLKLEQESINRKSGLWGSCNLYNDLNTNKMSKGRSLFFKEKPQFLAPVSTAWVRAVRDNKILLHNDIWVEVLSIKDFITGNKVIDQCISDLREQYLKKTLMGRKVFLEKDILQTKNHNTIYRHVWLPKTKYKYSVLMSEALIKSGLSLNNKTQENKKYTERLLQAEKQLLAEIPAPLGSCLSTQAPEEGPVLIKFDLDCPIKGNVSGSKKSPKKTYHTPLSGWYKRLKTERCFQDETEAVANGFVKVK